MSRFTRVSVALVLVSAWCVALGSPATAVAPTRTPSAPQGFGELAAGVACAFPISVDLVSGDKGQNFTFFDRNGNIVREMGTATHSTWRITNLDTGKSYTIPLPGGLLRATTSADGTTTVVISGGAIVAQAPTDTPPGPFTFTIVGRIVITIDANGHTTSLSTSGKRVDLCAAVAP